MLDLMKKSTDETEEYLQKILHLDRVLFDHFKEVIKIDDNLNRQVVSFQANKNRASYRWYKYKEAFSVSLVQHLLTEYHIPEGIVLDPFAGSGTTLFASSEMGYSSEGIELLPVGQQIIMNRIHASRLDRKNINRLQFWKNHRPWKQVESVEKINTLRITSGAYPQDTEKSLSQFLSAIKMETEPVCSILLFVLLCILESVSYTRKDGQYLRWDYRSGRIRGKTRFDKGIIYGFDEAITAKLLELINDIEEKNVQLDLFSASPARENTAAGVIELHSGSCLNILPKLQSLTYQVIITSPPYCNRYDYTRTYALEHAILGINEQELLDLRQKMLSCTVENREKSLLTINNDWGRAITACEENKLLQIIIEYLEYKKGVKELNNNGIPRMIKGYFYEMACVIQDCFRILKNNGMMFMVNDNVRYAGASISVDLILSKIAEDIGFKIENILVLPDGKGNSSQQMGAHGREVLRKCVYVWRKPNDNTGL